MSDLGQYAEGFNSWRKIIATVPTVDAKAKVFTNLAKEAADYVAKGLDKAAAVDALHDIATANGIIEAQGIDAVQTTIADAFTRAPESGGNGNGHDTEPAAKPFELVPINLARYDTEAMPTRQWGVLDRFPRLNVALLSGHGGVGKSLLLLQLAVAHALGKDWLRSLPEPGPVLLVNCEDDEGELVLRLQPILKHYGARYAEVAPDLHIFPLVDRDDETGQLLATVGRDGIVRPTPLYDALLAKARAIKPICIMIDNVADVFGGDEINRSQVRQFVALIRRLARAANGYVIMAAHPSLQGIASKSGLSGSTQWHNSVRSRAYLRGPDDKSGDTPTTDARVLEFMKSNYSALAEQITLKWINGLYLPAPTPSAPEAAAASAAAAKLFLDLLDQHMRKGANVSGNGAARNFAPRIFAGTKEAKQAGISERALADAMSRLIETDEIRAEPYGPPSAGYKRLVRRVTSSPLATPLATPSRHPPSPPPLSSPLYRGGDEEGVRDASGRRKKISDDG